MLYVKTNIANLNLSNNSLKDENTSYLCQTLSKNHTLVHLDLRNNGLTQKGVAILFNSLKKNNSICSVSIGNQDNHGDRNRMGELGAIAMGLYLESTSILTLLEIQNMNINDAATASLVWGLKAN